MHVQLRLTLFEVFKVASGDLRVCTSLREFLQVSFGDPRGIWH